MVAPNAPSCRVAAAVLLTVMPENRSESNTLKSNERPTLLPEFVIVSMPLISVVVNKGDRPRTAICLPSPLLRFSATPGMRWMDSDRLVSGNLAISSARMESTALVALRFCSRERSRLALKPDTVTLSTPGSAPCAKAPWEKPAIAQSAMAEPPDFKRVNKLENNMNPPCYARVTKRRALLLIWLRTLREIRLSRTFISENDFCPRN